MASLLVHHRVRDFVAWKAAFDGHAAAREAAGSVGGIVFQNADDPNDVVIVLQWDDVARARAFAASSGLRQAMDGAGVVGQPSVVFLEEAARTEV
jgi:heme-degrading monooxygenase HmoA